MQGQKDMEGLEGVTSDLNKQTWQKIGHDHGFKRRGS